MLFLNRSTMHLVFNKYNNFLFEYKEKSGYVCKLYTTKDSLFAKDSYQEKFVLHGNFKMTSSPIQKSICEDSYSTQLKELVQIMSYEILSRFVPDVTRCSEISRDETSQIVKMCLTTEESEAYLTRLGRFLNEKTPNLIATYRINDNLPVIGSAAISTDDGDEISNFTFTYDCVKIPDFVKAIVDKAGELL